MADPQQTISAEVELQAVKKELDLANKKIERYAHLVTTLYDELDTLRNTICDGCKKKLVPSTVSSSSVGPTSFSPIPLWRRVFGGGSRKPKANVGTPQKDTSGPRDPETPSASLSTKRVSESAFVPPPTTPPQTADVDINTEPPIIVQPDEVDWSVVHNQKATRNLNVQLAHTLNMKSKVFRVKFSRDGKNLAVGLQTGETYIYDLRTWSNRRLADYSVWDKPRMRSVWALQFSPDDKHIAVGSDAEIRIWNIAKKRVLAMFPQRHNYSVFAVDFSPDGRLLVSGSLDRSIRIWRTRDGSSKNLSDPGMSLVTSVAFSPDGRYVAAANDDGLLRVWEPRTGQLLEKWGPKANTQRLWFVAFTPDGKGLLSGGQDANVRSWDVSSVTANQSASRRDPAHGGTMDESKGISTFQRHTNSVYSISTLSDGRWILSGSSDHTVSIWDARIGTWQCILNGHQDAVLAVDASSDGLHIASGAEDGLVRVWSYEQVSLTQSTNFV